MPKSQPKVKRAPKANQSTPTVTAPAFRRNPVLDGAIAVVDFALAFLFFASALDTGSLLQYGLALIALALGVRSAVGVVAFIRRKRTRHEA